MRTSARSLSHLSGWAPRLDSAVWGAALLAFLAPAALRATAVIEITALTHSPTSVVAGSSTDLTYTITVANTATGASDDATNVLLVLPLTGTPLQYQSESITGATCSVVGGDLECDFGSMAESTSKSGDLVFRVAASAAPGTLTATFEATSDEDTTPDTESEDVTIDVEADLSVDKHSPSPDEAVPGQQVTYSIDVQNDGPSDATDVELADPAPTGWTFVSFGGDCAAATAPCDLGTIEPGAGNKKTATVTFSLPDDYHLVYGLTAVTNTATATTDTPDAGASDYSDSVSTPIVPKVDLSVVVASVPTSVTPGQPITYSVTVSKTGPSRLNAIHLTGAIADVLSQVYTPSEGTFSVSSTSPNWVGLDLAGSDSVSLSLSGWVRPAVTGANLVAQVTVQPPAGVTDTNGANDSDSESDTIARVADLRIVKTNDLDGVIPGQSVPYTITVYNEGPSDVLDATVTDTFSASFVSSVLWSCAVARDLTGLGELEDGVSGVDGLDGASSVVASPDGKHVYVAASADNSVAIFGRDATTGLLTYSSLLRDGVGASGIQGAAGVAISPDGATVYVTGSSEAALEAFSRNATTGALTSIDVERNGFGGVVNMTTPRGVAVAPDGLHVYVAAAGGNAVVAFTRNPATGALTWQSTVKNGDSHPGPVTVSGLGGARAVAVSPDGHSVVVAGETDNAVVVFSRDLATGGLQFVQVMTDSGPTNGLAGASGLAFSPQGNALYVTGFTDDAVVALSRNVTTGVLTYLEAERDGFGAPAVDGLDGARGVAVSPDGAFVYVAGANDNAIAIFSRLGSPQANQLEFRGIVGLEGARDLVMTPAGEQLYGVSASADKLGMFAETAGAACTVPGVSTLAFSEDVDLPAQSFVTYTATAVVSGSASGTLVNTASIAAPAGVTDALDPHPAGLCTLPPGNANNNSCTDSDQVGLEADLTVTKTPSAASAVPGGTLGYTVVVTNVGPAPVNGVSVSDSDLNGADLDAATWSCTAAGGAVCGSPTSGSGNINHAGNVNLPAGGSVTYAISVSIDPAASGVACTPPTSGSCLVNTSSATLPAGFVDPTPVDQTATVETPLALEAELQITKSILTPPGDIAAGAPLDFQIMVRNCGPSDVTGAQVQDTFSADYTVSGWTCVASGGSCAASGSADIDESVDLVGGNPADCSGAGTVTFTVLGSVVASPSTGVLTNIARVFPPSGVFDPTQGNNTANVQVGLQAEADLSVVKTDGTDTAVPGEEIVYTVTVSNSGPDDAQLVQVVDDLPAALRNVSWTCDSEAPATGLLTFVEEQRQGGSSDLGPIDGLAGARDLVVVPDADGPGPDPGGKFVYASGQTGTGAGAITIFSRAAATAELTYLGSVVDGTSQGLLTIDGLGGATGLAVSGDGLNLYAAGTTDDGIAVFTRNTTLGTLAFIEVVQDGETQGPVTVDGLDGVLELALSPDGRHLYATSPVDDSVAVFRREADNSGRLVFLQVLKDGDVQGALTVDGLDGATGVRVSPDGEHVYVTGLQDGAIAVFARETDENAATFGELTYIETLSDSVAIPHLAGASGLDISADGAYVYVAAASDNAVSIFSRNTSAGDPLNFGRLTYRDARFDGELSGLGGVASGLLGARVTRISPDGQHVYVAGRTSDAVVVFQRNSATGSLKFVEVRHDGEVNAACVQPPQCNINSLDGARAIAFSPAGEHLYVASDVDGTVSVFLRGGAPPAFSFSGGSPGAIPPAPVVDGVGGVDGLDGITDVALAGEHLYAVSFGDRSLVTFARDSVTGDLTYLGRLVENVGGVSGLAGATALTTFANSVYVVGQSVNAAENTLAFFARDPGTGLLTFQQVLRQSQGGVDGLFGAADVTVSPDGNHVYVVGLSPGSLAVFTRNPATGMLTFKEAKLAGGIGIVGLEGAQGVALSSDGEHVYVASSISDAVAVFRRNTNSADTSGFGRVSQIQVLQGLAGLDRAIGIAVSPDPGDGTSSRNVYVTGHTANALTVFQRNVDVASDDFGLLTPLQSFVDGSGVDGLGGARAVAVSPDGKQVYVAGENDDALAVFAREATGGTLVFVESRKDGTAGVDGLDQAYAIAISPNSRHSYVAGFGDDAIATFSRASGSRCTGAGVGSLVDENVEIAAGGQVVYTVRGTIDPGATGALVNEAYVIVPAAITDPGPDSTGLHPTGICPANSAPGYPAITDNNGCRDIDLLAPASDLALVKTDGDDVAIPGEELTYTITVSNAGPSNMVGASVSDDLSAIFPTGATWTCVASPSGTLSFLDAYFEGDTQPGPTTIVGLDGANAVAVSPDGAHVYVTGRAADSLAAFALDGATGALEFLAVYLDGVGAVTGLDGPAAVVVSPDGANVYVAGQVADAVAVFTRDANPVSPTYGELTFLEVQAAPAVSGLDQPVALALDPAGDNLYVAAANGDALVVFDRNTTTGALTFLELQQDGVGSVDGLAGASSVVVSPDGSHVYATGENDDAVVVFDRDGPTGALTFSQSKMDGVGGVDGLAGARSVAVSPDGANLYVAGTGESAIAVFSRDPALGTLTYRQVLRDGVGGADGLAGVSQLTVSDDGGFGFHVYAAGSGENAVAIYRRNAANQGRLEFVDAERDGFGAIDGLDGVGGVALAPDGRHLLAAGGVDDAVAVFRRPTDSSCSSGSDLVGPAIELVDTVNVAAGSKIVYRVTGLVDPDLCPSYPCTAVDLVNVATVTPPLGGNDPVAGNNTDTDTDDLSPRADLEITKTDHVSVIQGLAGAAAVAASHDGLSLYAVGRVGDGVAAFARSGATGALSFLESERDGVAGVDGLNGASAVLVSGDDRHVYVAGSADNAIAVFARETDPANPDFGTLTFLQKVQNGFGGVTGLLGPDGLALSIDGKHLYAAAANSSSVAIFSRVTDPGQPDFGHLAFVGEVRDGIAGVDGLNLARAVTLSPDGEHLYAVGESDNALAVFSRDAATGHLTFLEVHRDGVAGVTGLAGARGLAISPGGASVYASGGSANAVARFVRDTNPGSAGFGKLTFAGAFVDGVAGVDGLQGAAGLVVVPDPSGPDPGGEQLYVAGTAEDALAVFARDAGTGALTFVEAVRQGQAGVIGLAEPTALVLSPDAADLYVAGADEGSVVTLARDWDNGTQTGSGTLAFVERDREGDGTVSPGETLAYDIVVTNHGPSAVRGAVVTDIFPGELEDVSWECVGLTPGATCLLGLTGTGDLEKPVRLPPGGSVRITATGTIKPGVTGTIVNTATVGEPTGFIELDPSSNSATDGDTVLARVADLSIEKIACTDPLDCAATETGDLVPGTRVDYQLTVENLGPADVQGASVRDVLSETLANAAWTCVASPVPGLLSPLPPTVALRDGDDVPDVVRACRPTLTLLDGLAGASAVALSPDGLNLYATGAADNAVTVFRRDLRNGSLAYLDVRRDGETTYDASCVPTGAIDGLHGAAGVAVSPDGKHVYVTGELDDAIAVFSRSSTTGGLTFAQFLRDGVGAVNGLGNVRGVAISPDGAHVYTAAKSDNGVGIFARSASTGHLTYLGIRVDGTSQPPLTLDGLAGASAVAVSPDGAHVYVAGETDDGVAVFSRNASTGLLTFVEAKKDGVGGVNGLDGARAIAISDDGRHVYVAGSVDGAVAVFARNASTGALTFVEAVVDGVDGADGLAGASGVTVTPDDEHVYVASAGDSAVAVLARDAATGRLTPLPAAFDGALGIDGLAGARALAASPDGEQLYVAGAGENALALLRRNDGSRCTAAGFGNAVDAVDLVAGGSLVYQLAADLSAAAAGTLENRALVTPSDDAFDPVLDNNEAIHVANLTPVVDLTLDKDDFQTEAIPGLPVSYTITVTNSGPSDLTGATIEDLFPPIFLDPAWSCAATPALAFVEAERQGVNGVAGLDAPRGLVVSPDPDGAFGPLAGGEHVYVSSRASNAIDLFARDPGDGTLAFVASYVDGAGGMDGFGGAGGLAISPDGKFLYATGASDDAVAVLARNAASGALSLVEVQRESDPAIDGLDGAEAVAVSPDGADVYVASLDDDAVAVFQRNAETGGLVFVQRLKDGFGGLELGVIDEPVAIVVTPDGHQVLVASQASDSLAVFDRDAETGLLSFAQVLRDGAGGVDGLDFAQSVIVSPGGQFVYVAGLADDGIARFTRDLDSGHLTFASVVRDGVGGVDGLDGVRGLGISPDGLFVFAASFNADALAIFARDGGDGSLSPLYVAREGVGGVVGLDGARAVAGSPDGQHLYLVGEHSDAVAAFVRVGQGSCLGAGSGDISQVADLAVGATLTYQALGTVDPSATGLLVNTVTASMPPGTTNIGETSATDVDTLTPVADLAIAKSDGVSQAIPGTATIYLISVANSGPSDAPGAVVTDVLPPEVSSATWTCSGHLGGSCGASGSGGLAESVGVPAGADVVFALAATIDPAATGTVSNTATVAPGPGVTDPQAANDASTDVDVLVPTADLSLVKTVDDDHVEVGDPLQFTLTVTNAGPSVATALSVIDLLPAGTNVVAAAGSGWSCSIASGSVTCTRPSLASGSAPPILIDATAPTTAGSYVNGATVTAASSDPAAANNTGTAAFTVVVLEPPTVVMVDSVDGTGDGELTQMETAEVAITELTIEFSEAMFDPAGDSDPHDVTNPASYQLLAAGPDGIFTTATCGAPNGDDVSIAVDSVAYSSATLTADLTLQAGDPLRDGLYRLLVCGANGVLDLDGNAIDGNADGTPGDDFARFFRVSVANVLDRPYFDFASDLGAWTVVSGVHANIIHDAADGDGFPLSGSLRFVNLSGETTMEVVECMPLVGMPSWVYAGELRATVTAGSVIVRGLLDYAVGGSCISPATTLASWPTSSVAADTGGAWRRVSGIAAEPPVGATGIRARWRVQASAGAVFDVGFDNLTLVQPLFADGFETGSTSRWSSTSP